MVMYNWSVDEKASKKANPERYQIWKLEQLIHYGEPGEKIPVQPLKKYWNQLNIDPQYRAYLKLLLWPRSKKQS